MDISQEGIIMIRYDKSEKLFNTKLACAKCSINFEEIQPRSFSFNSPFGACPECHGLGAQLEFAADLVVPNPYLSMNEGAVKPWKTQMFGFQGQKMQTLADHYDFD